MPENFIKELQKLYISEDIPESIVAVLERTVS